MTSTLKKIFDYTTDNNILAISRLRPKKPKKINFAKNNTMPKFF